MSSRNRLAETALASARAWIAARRSAPSPRAVIPPPLSPDPSRELAEARAVFDALVALEARYDPALIALYAEDGLVIERIVEAGRELRRREIPMRRYRAALPKALALAARARITATHAQVSLHAIAPGWVQVRSQRASSQSRAPGPYEIVVKRESDAWRIVKETATLVR